jgi:hypothetical protein
VIAVTIALTAALALIGTVMQDVKKQTQDSNYAAHMARTLHRRGILTKLRQSAGQDVDAGCGQLRARAADGSAAPVRRIAITAVAALQPSTATR